MICVQQQNVYTNRDVNVYFDIKKGGYEDGTEHETRFHAARKTLKRQTRRELKDGRLWLGKRWG